MENVDADVHFRANSGHQSNNTTFMSTAVPPSQPNFETSAQWQTICASGTAELGSCLTDATPESRSRRAVLNSPLRQARTFGASDCRGISDPVVPFTKPPCLTSQIERAMETLPEDCDRGT